MLVDVCQDLNVCCTNENGHNVLLVFMKMNLILQIIFSLFQVFVSEEFSEEEVGNVYMILHYLDSKVS